MLTSYGKLDKTCLNSDFTAMAKVIKSNVIKKDVREAIQSCRDLALGITLNIEALTRSLSGALKLMCMAQEDLETRIIKQRRVDQGMSERYRPLTKRLQRERIKKNQQGSDIYQFPHRKPRNQQIGAPNRGETSCPDSASHLKGARSGDKPIPSKGP